MSERVALITGITGQDGAYLAELLLEKATLSTASSAVRPRSTPSASTISIRIRICRACASSALRRHDRCDQSHPHRAGNAAARNLQSRRAEPRPGQLRDAGIHRQRRRARHAAAAGSDPHSQAWRSRTRFYQASTSELYGKVQEVAAERNDAVLPALPLRGGEALCLLDHGELSRGLWHARLERHPVQS